MVKHDPKTVASMKPTAAWKAHRKELGLARRKLVWAAVGAALSIGTRESIASGTKTATVKCGNDIIFDAAGTDFTVEMPSLKDVLTPLLEPMMALVQRESAEEEPTNGTSDGTVTDLKGPRTVDPEHSDQIMKLVQAYFDLVIGIKTEWSIHKERGYSYQVKFGDGTSLFEVHGMDFKVTTNFGLLVKSLREPLTELMRVNAKGRSIPMYDAETVGTSALRNAV